MEALNIEEQKMPDTQPDDDDKYASSDNKDSSGYTTNEEREAMIRKEV